MSRTISYEGISFDHAAAAMIPDLYDVAPVDTHVGQRVVGQVRGRYPDPSKLTGMLQRSG